MSSLSEKVAALKEKLGDAAPSLPSEGSRQNTYFLITIAAVPIAAFIGLYFALKPNKDGSKNYKKILMWSLIISLVLIPAIYFASLNGYLPF